MGSQVICAIIPWCYVGKMYTVYSKTGCPYCDAVEKLFNMKGIEYTKYMLGKDFTREEFVAKFGRSTFPRVLGEDGNLIGGATETVAFLKESGVL